MAEVAISKHSTSVLGYGFLNQIQSGVLTDAVILQTRFDYNQFSLGFSYDVNVSPLKPASNNNGAFEFALVYKFCGDISRGVYCPNW